jgi:hypothetical protein
MEVRLADNVTWFLVLDDGDSAGEARAFSFLWTPNTSEYFIRSTVCPTPKVTASLMVVPRTTMSLMSGAFGYVEIRVADLWLKLNAS